MDFHHSDSVVTVRLGKQDINTEFLLIDKAEDFIQSTFGLSPSTAYPTYPASSIAAVALIQINEHRKLKTGLWDAFASGGGWGFSGNDSVVAIGELECSYALAEGALPGVFAVGAVYESAGVIEGVPVSPIHEYIIQLEQLIYREGYGNDDAIQGPGVFAGYYPLFPGSQISPSSIGDSFVAVEFVRMPNATGILVNSTTGSSQAAARLKASAWKHRDYASRRSQLS